MNGKNFTKPTTTCTTCWYANLLPVPTLLVGQLYDVLVKEMVIVKIDAKLARIACCKNSNGVTAKAASFFQHSTHSTFYSFEFSKFWVELLFLWSPFSIWFNQRQRVGIQFIQQIVPHQLIHHSHSKAAHLTVAACSFSGLSYLIWLDLGWSFSLEWVGSF